MSKDGYAYCPCGSGKKLKFCCSKDIVSDLDQATRALEGDQRKAGLDLLDRFLAKHGPRPALLALKCTAQLQTGDLKGAAETVATFQQQAPDNPVAAAAAAIVAVTQSDGKAAAAEMQKALEHSTEAMHSIVFEAIGLVGRALVTAGSVPAGLAYLLLHLTISQGQESQSAQIVAQIHRSKDVPLLLKGWGYPGSLSPPPEESRWADDFEAARQLAWRGAWAAAAAKLESAAGSNVEDPTLLKNLAILKSWLDEGAAEAWRRYAACAGLALDESVEAEAIAQLLEPARDDRLIDVVRVVQPITDAGQALERMLSDRRFVSEEIGHFPPEEEEPRPKAALTLLDRPLPASAAALSVRDIPNALGAFFVYGRQTDRAARVELVTRRTDDLVAAKTVLGEILADLAEQPANEEVVDQIPAVSVALGANWRLPSDTPPDVQARLYAEHTEMTLSERWPDLPLPSLDGRTPREVAADPAYQIRVLASILLLEMATTADGTQFDFNSLRQNLGLPTRDPIDPATVDVSQIPLVRLTLLPPQQLTDDDLLDCYERADHFGMVSAIRGLAREAIARESLDKRIDKAAAHHWLARTAKDLEEATEHLQAARQAARAQGQSPAPWLLAELAMQLQYQNLERCQSLFEELRTKYIREPGVAESLFSILNRFGLIGEDGMPAVGPAPSAAEVGEPAASTSQLWTPGQAGPASGEKSKLWVPGAE